MARIRTIKPEFWDDEKLARFPYLTRLLYIGTWTFSDDYGVVKGDTEWLRSKIFPYNDIDSDDFKQSLDNLVSIERLIPFTFQNEKYFFIPKFEQHQYIPKKSKYTNPEPPDEIKNKYS